jgi:succinoglycan biosynthesis transport protein ExoP
MEEHLSLVMRERRTLALTPRSAVSVLFRKRRVFLLTFLGVLAGTVLAIALIPPSYESDMKILVERARYDPVVTADSKEGVSSAQLTPPTEQDVNSEVDLLLSTDLLQRVVLECKLQEFDSWLWKILPRPSHDERVDMAVRSLTKYVRVVPPNKSNLIDVSYTNPDPQMAAKVLSVLGNQYLLKYVEVHRPMGTDAFFDREIERYRQELNDSQARLTEFERTHDVVAADSEKSSALQRVSELEATLQTTQAALAETENRIKMLQQQLKMTPSRMVTQVRTSAALLEQLKSTLFTLELKRTELLGKYAPSYRAVQEVEKQIADTKAAIAAAEKQPTVEQTTDKDETHAWLTSELAKANTDLAALRGRDKETRGGIAVYRDRAKKLEQDSMQQSVLAHTAEMTQQNYLASLRKKEEARMSNALDRQRIFNVSIAQQATIPAVPVYSLPLKLALGFGLAFMISIGTAAAADYWDPTFRTPDELRDVLSLPVLAAVPAAQELAVAGGPADEGYGRPPAKAD